MAVVWIKPLIERKGSREAQRKGSLLEIVNRKYTKRFEVMTNNVLDGVALILSWPGVPKIGETYVFGTDLDRIATCVHVDCDATSLPYLWHVTAQYDTSRLVDARLDNPLLMPPEVSWGFAQYNRVLTRDLLGTNVVNSSKEWFDPPVEIEDSRPVLTVIRNETRFDPALAVLYQDAVNSDIFAGQPPRSAKVNAISGARQIDVGFIYYKVTYEIQFRRESYDLFLLDQGFRDADTRIFRDPIDAAPYGHPTLLNGRGRRLTSATSTLAGAITSTATTLSIQGGDSTKFPPLTPTPPHWYFEVRIDNEVIRVIDKDTKPDGNVWTVIRGWANTAPAAHADLAPVRLEPYFLRFLPHKLLPFSALRLPTV